MRRTTILSGVRLIRDAEVIAPNLHHLAVDPIRVLLSSLLWIDGYFCWPYLIVFCLFLGPGA